MNEYEYNEHAWRRALLEEVVKDIEKKYVKGDGAHETIICPYLPAAVAEVPQRVVHTVLNQLILEATHYRLACEAGRGTDPGIARNREPIPSTTPTPNPVEIEPDAASDKVRKPKQARKKPTSSRSS